MRGRIVIHPMEPETPYGREYAAFCGDEILERHFCSSDSFAKADLGFYKPEELGENSREFARSCREHYLKLFPEGFDVEFSADIMEVRNNMGGL